MMICPNCKKESNGTRWCTGCGTLLERQNEQPPITDKANDYIKDGNNVKEDENYIYGYEEDDDSGLSSGTKVALAIVIPIVLVVVSFVILYLAGVIHIDKKQKPAEEKVVVLENEDTDKLMKTGMNHLKVGAYEDAETVFKALMESDPDNEDVVILYNITFNYNRAAKRIRSKNYKDARSYFDKIPIEYTGYDISDDIENLEKEIERFEVAYETFSELKELMSSSDYENAQKTVELVDKTCLTNADLKQLESYKSEIEDFLETEKDKNREDAKDKEKDTSENTLSEKEAGDIVRTYCKAYVNAVNEGDFSKVSHLIKGELYDMQEGMVESLYGQGVTEEFDFLTVKSVQKISDNKWKVNVSEGETIYYPDGDVVEKTYAWAYTVELINSKYYLTNIE